MCLKAVLYVSGHHGQYVALFYARKRGKGLHYWFEKWRGFLPSCLLDHDSFPYWPYTPLPQICNSCIRVAVIFSQSELFLASLDVTCSLSLPTPDFWFAHNEIVGALGTLKEKTPALNKSPSGPILILLMLLMCKFLPCYPPRSSLFLSVSTARVTKSPFPPTM